MQMMKSSYDLKCEACIEGKQVRQHFLSDKVTRVGKVLEIVYFDVCGLMKTTSIGGVNFFFTFINDFSRKIWVFIFKCKSDVYERFKA